jgi:hypothetical protein
VFVCVHPAEERDRARCALNTIDGLFRALFATVYADFPQGRYFSSLPNFKESELWRDRLEKGSLYGDPGAFTAGAADAARSR